MEEDMEETISKNFIEQIIEKDIEEGHCKKVVTRFPPEPNGYLHIGHAKSILLNYGLAQEYGGDFHFRFDDTNPTKEKEEYVNSIKEDVEWLGADYHEHIYYASNYFDKMYECAEFLIKKGKAYVCDLNAEQIREYRGTLTEPGKNSPYRDRTPEENLQLFREMKEGKYPDGSKVLRAKIDMTSGNINMRDPILYRIARMEHHNTGNKWCIYPMYDFAHPLEDAFEGVTHSICTLEFEDHRPLYDWVVNECEFENPPKQIEFAKLYLTNVVTGKRYIKKLVEDGIVDGWDDPRLVSLSALRRRGYTPESIKKFMELVGVAKSHSSVDSAMLEYCIRDDLKLKRPRMAAILDPIKLVITNYPEGEGELVDVPNNQENEEMGTRQVPFSRELYIEREDFKIEKPKKYRRLYVGNEVRLMNAYFVTCTGYDVDEDGNVYYMTEHENFGKMIEFLSKCQQEGLLDPDWAVNTSSTVQEKLAGGKAIIAQINRNGLGETTPTMLETLGLTYDDLGYIGALKGSDGTCKYMRTEAINFVTVILRGSENAADAVNWINLKQQNQLYINIGVEGTHFNYDEDGGIAPINPIFAEERGNSYWYIDSTNEEEFATEWPSRVRKSDAQWAGFEAVTLYANENTPEIFVNNDFAFKPATENYAKYNTALFSSMNDYILQILAGSKTLDDLPTFQADWKNAGGDAVQAELQAWYDSFYG